MAVKEWSRFEKVATAWLFSIAVMLVATYIYVESLPGESSNAIQAVVSMVGLFSALGILAILLIRKISIRKISVIGVVLAVAIGAFCYYLSEAFPSLKRYPYAVVFAIWMVFRENQQLKKYDAVAAKLFFVALGYLCGLAIRTSRWVREAFSLGMAAALRDKGVPDHKDDSHGTP